MSNPLSWGSGPVQARLTCGDLVLSPAEVLRLSHTAACCDGDIGLGQVCAATLTATLTGARDLLNETITAELGAGDPLVWHELGTFVVTQCQRGEDSTTVSACDAAWYALSAVYAPTVDSGADVYDVLEDLADQCGLDVEQTTLNLGLGISVTGDLTGHTCRAMLGYLAALCGCNCVVSRAGALRFVWFAASGAGIDADTTYAGANTHCGLSTLTGLRCTVSDGSGETALTAGDADTAVEFSCPYMTQTRLDALWNTLGGYQYPVLEVSCYGGAEVQPGDLVTVTDLAGNSLSVPVMEVNLSVDGGCRCTLRSFGQSDTGRSCDGAGPVVQQVRRAQRTAGAALLSANGKNKVFHQASAPTAAAGLTADDIWFDTANGNRISTWTGSAWSAFGLGSDAIANLSITNAKIADATIQSGKIASVDAGSITAGTLNAARIAAGSITADKLDVDDLFAQDISVTGTFQVETDHYGQTIKPDGYKLWAGKEVDGAWQEANIYLHEHGIVGLTGTSQANLISEDGSVNLVGSLVTIQSTDRPTTIYGSVLEGTARLASGDQSHAEGNYTYATGDYSHAEGSNTTAAGECAHSEGLLTHANSDYSHAEGYGTTAGGARSHAEGTSTTASGSNSHAEGASTTASGGNAHAEGGSTTASNWDAHAEGSETTASGDKSHAEGKGSVASGARSHAGGYYTIANGANQTAIGAYNIADTSSLFIIGNGTADNSRSNAMTVDGSGNVNISGQFKRHGNNFIVVEQKSFNASCSANSYSNQSGSVEKSGYTPIGVVGYDVTGSNSSHICVYRLIIDGNLIRWNLRNYGSSNYSSTITVRILYMAN